MRIPDRQIVVVGLAVTIIILAIVLTASFLQWADVQAGHAVLQSSYVASSGREPFHKPTCEWAQKIKRENMEVFLSREEAIEAGHRPCKICKP